MPPAAASTTDVPADGAPPGWLRRRMEPRMLSSARLCIGLVGAWLLVLGIVAALGGSTVGILHEGGTASVKGIGAGVALFAAATLCAAWAMAVFSRLVALLLSGVVLIGTVLIASQRVTTLNLIVVVLAALAVGLTAGAPGTAFPTQRRSWREVAPVPVVVVVRRIDRVRGSGWLNCPNCHEHASQDVVDELLFLALLFFRFTPIHRRRVIVCRRCGYHRRATAPELAQLNTAGEPVRAAWLFPMGFAAIALIAGSVVFLTTRVDTSASSSITYITAADTGVAPVTLEVPGGVWEFGVNKDLGGPSPQYIRSRETNGSVELDRFPLEGGDVTGLYTRHYADVTSLDVLGFPTSPPKPDHIKVDGIDALHFRATYQNSGTPAVTSFYAFVHQGVGYTLTFFSQGGELTILDGPDGVEAHVLASLKFTDQTETAQPCATPTPALPTAIPGAPSPTPTQQPSTSPEPTCIPAASPTPAVSAAPGGSATASPSG